MTDHSSYKPFRAYSESKTSIDEFYRENHEKQTYDFVRRAHTQWTGIPGKGLTVFELLNKLDGIVDESDPDTSLNQTIHAFQSAERARKLYPEEEWLIVTALLHDCGKIVAHKEHGNLPQWMVVGDIYPVGCAFSNKVVYPEYFKNNPDKKHKIHNTPIGIYDMNGGLDQLMMSFSHDFVMYDLLKRHSNCLPEHALYAIRYHSFYAYHREGGYQHFLNETDRKMLPYLKMLNQCDLYSKQDEVPDVHALRPFYDKLLQNFGLGGKLW